MERRSGLGLAALGALGRRLLWALPAYAAGLLGLGAGAVVLALALYAGWRRRRRARERGMRAAERLHRDEEAAVRAAAAGLGAARGELPAWVSFPDVERAEWLNKLHGMLRIILEPLLGDVPIVGALSMFFIRRPTLDINWTGMTNLLDIPGLSSMSDTMIMDTISSYLVLPNRLLVPLVPDLPEAAQLRSPLPRGVLRVHLLGARSLRCKDRFLGGLLEGRSDPYALLRVGTQAATSGVIPGCLCPRWNEVHERVLRLELLEAEALVAKDQRLGGLGRGRSDPYAKIRAGGSGFRSRVIREELNPRWNETYEAIVDDIPGQDVEFELFDKDIDKDDFLGRCNLGGPGGIFGVVHTNSLLQPAHGPELSAALLSVFLDRAADLPLRKGSKPPAAFASLAVRDVSFKTKTCAPSTEPVWDEGFSFLIKRPHVESLELQVKDEGGQALGSLSLPLAELLAREGLAMDGWVPLAGGGPGAQLLLRAQLGVLVSQRVEASAASRAPEGGDTEPRQEEEEEEEGEDEERGVGGLRQRLPPADSRPEPPEGPRLQLSLWYHQEQRKLVAIVHSCRELRAAGKELPDPYVSLVLLPDRSRGTKRKTGVQRRSLNPDFNERFEWELSPEEAARRRLEATVKTTLSFVTREKEALGKVRGGPEEGLGGLGGS
ncbi:PREDICTED: extended synaptotagmin-1 [Pseudopodoces humilis]|uniref:extended synaptotagmin-1 n=1 Tax=Pseudopodoces humilis TaxID=181119 RepID=UPI0006B72BE8|nr:PREDICTED: extended synaptotagmin-1 [Pseudopodoces humilis]